ncbi:MAG: M20 family metallo-hydrolase [Prevotella sp.]|nr:M20 family metallo-hydrolase [Prevotella sp.]MDY5928201.1 M20 family metallo-hydrolase [Prevotella sp.]MEE1205660.1 M20 family metallo-hydrolase [Prevotella sp.]
MTAQQYTGEAVSLLSHLIATPSVSREERRAADIMEEELTRCGFTPHREANNVWAIGPCQREDRPTLLLNAHIDTVKPVASYTRNPYEPSLEDGTLYGLGSNDCGGGLVSLLQVFRELSASERCPYNLVYLASAEEEVSGKDGISRALPLLPHVDVAIVGEPTGMQPAVAEKGLMVVDITAHGKSGHAARNEGVNAIYEALDDLCWIRSHRFDRVSRFLGPTKMQATVVNAGTQHNVVPDECKIVVDVRTNELYTNEEVFDIISSHCKSECRARSFRLHSSRIDLNHPLVERCVALGLQPFGSPTLSDQALMPFASLKLGPGQSARSHSADEYIKVSEIEHAIGLYLRLLER